MRGRVGAELQEVPERVLQQLPHSASSSRYIACRTRRTTVQSKQQHMSHTPTSSYEMRSKLQAHPFKLCAPPPPRTRTHTHTVQAEEAEPHDDQQPGPEGC